MSKPASVFLILISLLGLLLFGCKGHPVAPSEPPSTSGPRTIVLDPVAEAAARLATVEVVEAPWSTSVSATGNLDYDASRVSPVSARVPGRVAEIRADLGRSVPKGEALCLIDSPDAGEAQASFLKAASEMNLKQKSYDRARMLLDSQAISQGEFLERQAAFEGARSEMALAENRLHLQKAVLAELIAANEARRRAPEVSPPAATPSGRG